MSPTQVLHLLTSPAPTTAEIKEELKALAQLCAGITSVTGCLTCFPDPDSALAKAIFACCVYIFLNPGQDAGCRQKLDQILQQEDYNNLMALLSYIKNCHVWVEAHPALAYQIDLWAQASLEALFVAEPRFVEFFCNYKESIQQERQHQNSDRTSSLEVLQHKEDLFSQLTENIRQVFWINSPEQQKIFYISPAYEEIWGQSRQKLYENPASFLDSVHPEDRDRVIAAWPQPIQRESEVEYRIIRPDGSIRWIRDRAFPILNEQGIDRIVGIADDITDRKQLQEELRKSEERLNFALEAARMGRWEWNILTNEIIWSENLESLFGLKKGTFNGTYEAFIQCVHPQDREFVKRSVMQAVEDGAEYDIEFRVVFPDGTIRWALSKGYVFYDLDGKAVRMAGVDIDITKRKQIEQQLRLLESVVVNAKDSILITEAEPIEQPGPGILYVNAAFTRMTGYTCEEIIGKSPRLLQGSSSDRATLDKIGAALQNWQPICVELINYRKDGSEFWVEMSIVPVADKNGCYTHWIGIQRDITERKQGEAEYQMLLAAEQAARTTAEAANRTKDEFLAIVSHELRSPLNAILGWSRLLRTRKFDAEKSAYALEVIERNARLQTQLIEDLLDISRMMRGKLHLNLIEVNLISVIEAAIDVVRSNADSKNIQLNFIVNSNVEDRSQELEVTSQESGVRSQESGVRSQESGVRSQESGEHTISPSFPSFPNSRTASPPLVMGDPVRLQQIVWNLLSNAVKFTPEGGRVRMELSVVSGQPSVEGKQKTTNKEQLTTDKYAQIKVSDTGKGISAEFLPYVFDRFRQADSTITRSQSGLGLGLAIVRNLVDLHNGSVSVESSGEGQGATFIVNLPLLELRSQNSEFRSQEERNSSGSRQLAPESCLLNNLHILVVDDEADTRDLITTVLKQYGAKVTAVGSVAEALEAVERLQLDVLVSDIGMPEENGYSLIRKLRQIEAERGGRIPAVALTAYTRSEDRAAAIAAGFQIHLPKPVEPAQLAAVVANVVKANSAISD
jgi:PAS domain S-box-containing protein